MAGIYIHIPFCRKACYYCNFHFSTTLHLKTEYINALLKEIDIRSSYVESEEIQTIYFGGGTPSLLSQSELNSIFNTLYKNFSIGNNIEITLETNPDDISSENLSIWKQTGINRLSIGIQSFYEEDLQWMNRAHNATQAKQAILLSQDAGFDNITIDLIYGTPTLTNDKWKHNVETALGLNIPHLSCYALTVEPHTALHKLIEKRKLPDVNADIQSQQFLDLMKWLAAAGYEHYEISNFAKPGFRSKHNASYWHGEKYIGLGPSAHSFNRASRQWNIANNALYIKHINTGNDFYEKEILTPTQQLNEYIMTALRTIEGIDAGKVKNQFGETAYNNVITGVQKYISSGKVIKNNNHICLTNEGKLFADGIAADLFEVAG